MSNECHIKASCLWYLIPQKYVRSNVSFLSSFDTSTQYWLIKRDREYGMSWEFQFEFQFLSIALDYRISLHSTISSDCSSLLFDVKFDSKLLHTHKGDATTIKKFFKVHFYLSLTHSLSFIASIFSYRLEQQFFSSFHSLSLTFSPKLHHTAQKKVWKRLFKAKIKISTQLSSLTCERSRKENFSFEMQKERVAQTKSHNHFLTIDFEINLSSSEMLLLLTQRLKWLLRRREKTEEKGFFAVKKKVIEFSFLFE